MDRSPIPMHDPLAGQNPRRAEVGPIAHEFTNFLTIINGYSALVLKRMPIDDPYRRYLEEIHHAGQQAAVLAQHFLNTCLSSSQPVAETPVEPRWKILVVDDQDGIRALLQEILESAGHQVRTASDGRKAMESMLEERVDLVITDLVMPDQEGIETIRLLRKQYPEVKVIAMSGQFGSQFLKMAELLGASATLTKPVSEEALLQTIDKIFEGPVPIA